MMVGRNTFWLQFLLAVCHPSRGCVPVGRFWGAFRALDESCVRDVYGFYVSRRFSFGELLIFFKEEWISFV